MARNSKKKLAIFVGTSKCLIYAEAKFCASDIPGEIKYYECSRTEYCCAFGCCVSPGFHFHHLWYYWILVIIMFLVCSGGGWWYRYWLQGRYRAAASAIPTRSSTTRSQSSLRNASCQAQQARITYNSARNTVLLHRMWKGPQRNTAAPAYNGNATTSTHYQNMNVVLNDANCPYYQLYGPPPSYETVIAQTRGKISNPASPESSAARLNLQTANVIPNPSVPQCFFYNCNSPARLVDEYPEEPIASGGSNFSCNYQNSPHRLPGYPTDRLPNVSDAENVARGYEIPNTEHAILNIDAATSSYRECNPWHENDQSVRVHGKITMQDETRTSQKRCMTTTDMHTLLPKESRSENELKRTFNVIPVMQRNFPRGRTSYGGSLRLPRRHTGIIYQGDGFQNVLPRDSSNASQWSTFNSAQTAASEGASFLERDANSSQSNPSNNVILESFIFENVQLPPSENVEEARGLRAMNRNINFDLESKHKLDRSKSLD
ncbi:PREDICTED: uncharacterized protein LOC108751719 isoform X2 [Trachymyrmex septentrionalis]|uniref:uncharacterized protein LOC108751719 isoform X2 n=1 Tax=Trachymyrmex septentrionalis TaxID=34720 RepID=UPI00084F3A46|nr:PREDICTED: uncharacterized protein LOC108751719 isoform X2 [Trachymyrmex septentrionalis]